MKGSGFWKAGRQAGRQAELDYAKGFAILLLILSHCIAYESLLKTWIFSFHMPIFFVICGILQEKKHQRGLNRNELQPYLQKRFRQLIIPYFVFGTVLITFYQALHLIAGEELSFAEQLKSLVTLQGVDSLWFIPVYLITEMTFITLALKLPAALRLALAGCCVIVICWLQTYGFPDNGVLRLLIKCAAALVFVYGGYLVEKYKMLDHVHVGFSFCGVVFLALTALYNGFVGIGSLQFQNVILYFVNGLGSSVFIIAIFKWMAAKTLRMKLLEWFGKNSIVVLCTNNLLIEIVRLADYEITGNILLSSGFVGSAVMASMITIMEMVFIRISEGKLGVLFGKGDFSIFSKIGQTNRED